MNQFTLFDLDEIPIVEPVPEPVFRYHLYIIVDGIRHCLYGHKRLHYNDSGWQWLTDEEAGKRRKKHAYTRMQDVAAAQRVWQHKAKDGVIVWIDAVEVEA